MGLKQGQGHFVQENGNSYTGEFLANEIHGKGKYHWKDGKTYEG